METKIQEDVKTGAASSAAEDVKTPSTFEDVVQQFADKSASEGKEAGSSPEDEEAQEGAGQETTKTEAGESEEEEKVAEKADSAAQEESTKESEEGKETSGKTEQSIPYERFQEVNERAKQYEPLAVAQSQLQQYCHENGISNEDFQQALQLLAMRRSNPTEAAKQLSAWAENLEVMTGGKLPRDLAEEVEAGTISEARAKEIAQLRVKSTTQAKSSELSAQEQQQRYIADMTQGLTQWSVSRQKQDPDFRPKKSPDAADGKFEDFIVRFQYRTQQKPPSTLADMVALAEQAYKDVNEMITRYRPTPTKKKVLTATSASTTIKAPKSFDDVVDVVAKKHGLR